MNNNNNQPPFAIGQKVVCVNECEEWMARFIGMIHIKKGQVVTVRKYSNAVGYVGIFFEEIINTPYEFFPEVDGNEGCYHSQNFAPINPYANSVAKELAEKAMDTGDKADMPIKIVADPATS